MTAAQATQPDTRLPALDRLMAEISTLAEQGRLAPCTRATIGHWWVSEVQEQLDAAALACSSCPALAACATYVREHPEPAGVWAGESRRALRVEAVAS